MHRVERVVAEVGIAAVLLLGLEQFTALAVPAGKGARCDPRINVCKVVADLPSEGEGPSTARDVSTRATSGLRPTRKAVDPCKARLAVPQPPKSDPVWNGASTGTILVQPCWLITQVGGRLFYAAPADLGEGAAAVSSPEELAEQALRDIRQLELPDPVMHRSPDVSTMDGGVPVTWVNAWTWVWTSPQSWRHLSRTATAGPFWATVTVRPIRLVFYPDRGVAPVSCPGPGRAWTPADGNGKPPAGGCGYVYRSVSPGVHAGVGIRWAVTWTGSGGSSGQFPDMTTRTDEQFAVQQIQVEQVQEANG